ncbi:MAG: hypothetical protein ACJATN_002148 [Neolewinella sp.]
MAGSFVNLVIVGYDVPYTRFFYGVAEGLEGNFTQRPFGDTGRGDVVATFGFAVAGHLFESGKGFVFVPFTVVALEA